jgi:hypothetical protein
MIRDARGAVFVDALAVDLDLIDAMDIIDVICGVVDDQEFDLGELPRRVEVRPFDYWIPFQIIRHVDDHWRVRNGDHRLRIRGWWFDYYHIRIGLRWSPSKQIPKERFNEVKK